MPRPTVAAGLVAASALGLAACTGRIPPSLEPCPEVPAEEAPAISSAEAAVAAVRAHLGATLPAFELDPSEVDETERAWYVDVFRVCKADGAVENALRL